MPHVGKNRQPGKEHHEQYGDPARRAWTLVMVGFLRARYVWRNTHSASSVNYSDALPSGRVRRKLWPLPSRVSMPGSCARVGAANIIARHVAARMRKPASGLTLRWSNRHEG